MTTLLARLTCTALLPLLLGCSLTSREVEPDLPDGRLDNNDTLACHIDQKSAVASNYSNLGTVVAALFGGDTRPVVGKLDASGTLYIRGMFIGSQAVGVKDRAIRLALPTFKGTGTYPLTSPGTYFQEYTPSATLPGPSTALTFSLVPATPAQVIITEWDVTTQHLRGTFTLTVAAAPGTTQNVPITDGRFDLIVD